MDKRFENLLPDQLTDGLETYFVASGTRVQPSSWVDFDLFIERSIFMVLLYGKMIEHKYSWNLQNILLLKFINEVN